MPLSIDDLSGAREAVEGLLDELGLTTYIFEVEPQGDMWQVRVECAFDEGWQVISLDASHETLQASVQDAEVRGHLLDSWQSHLTSCIRE